MECPESIEQLEELEEKWIPLCRKGLYEQAQARKNADPDKSERTIAKELAEEAGVPTETVRHAIYREKKSKVVDPQPPPKPERKSVSVKTPPQCSIPSKTQVISDAMAFAITAISHLERIDPDDPERTNALNFVDEWIINNI